MASEALSIPFDIPWRRLAWSRDMLDRAFGGSLPPKWRSSLAVYAYPVPVADTEDDYPDARIVYLKLTASITGWSPREVLDAYLVGDPVWDPWQLAAWDLVGTSTPLNRTYWPCVSAIAQIGIYPHGIDDVADDDYPHIVDFEPKKRELYETVTDTKESLSGSSGNVNIRKGNTSTHSVEVTASVDVPYVSASAAYSYQHEHVDITTTDESTERRETAGRSTQLSQMYQLFNGYHIGTNRAVFALFPRPHIVAASAQISGNLINGERRLEGIQDVFLVIHVPRNLPGICVQAFLDTGHKLYPDSAQPQALLVTRRTVGGCGEFDGDILQPRPPPVAPPRVPPVVGEHQLEPLTRLHRKRLAGGTQARAAVADDLNIAQVDVRNAVLGDVVGGAYQPRDLIATDTFAQLAGDAMRASTFDVAVLVRLGYITSDEEAILRRLGITTAGALFAVAGEIPTVVADVRRRLLRALTARKDPSSPTG